MTRVKILLSSQKVIILLLSLVYLRTISVAQTNMWKLFTPNNSGLPSRYVPSMVTDKFGKLWFVTDIWSITCYDNGIWTTYTIPDTIGSFVGKITPDPVDGTLWIGTLHGSDAGILKFDGNSWFNYPKGDVYDLEIDSSRKKWVSFQNGNKLWSFNDTVWTPHIPPISTIEGISDIAVDKDQSIWLTATMNGVRLFHVTTTEWVMITPENSGLPDSNVFGVTIDEWGKKWFSLDSNIVSYDNQTWTVYKEGELGLKHFTRKYFAFDSIGLPWISSIDSQNAWIQHFNGSFWDAYQIPFNVHYAGAIVMDSLQNKWVKTDSGVVVFNENGLVLDVQHQSFENEFSYQLSQNYPNPFNSSTMIRYTLTKSELVKIKVFNLLGKEISNLIEQTEPVGEHFLRFSSEGLSSGVYFFHLQTSSFSIIKRVLIIK
jgi:ligand-binding sensor domain-containing protein